MKQHLATLAALLVISAAAHAAPYCQGDSDDVPASVNLAVTNWEDMNSAKVAQPVKRAVTKEFCTAANSAISDKVADVQSVDRATQKVMTDFFDRQTGKGGKPRSMAASMREELGVAGLSRPQFQRFVLIVFSYTKPVDGLMVDDDHYPKQTKMLVPIGKHLVKALQGASVLCSQTVDAKAGVESAFGC